MINYLKSQALTFDDILLVPRKSTVLPKETDISTQLTRRIRIKIPIISAPMDTVTEHQMAIALAAQGGIGIIHRNLDVAEQVEQVKKSKAAIRQFTAPLGAAISVGDQQFKRALKLIASGVMVLVVDTAHGHSAGVINMIKRLKADSRFNRVDVIAGNIATAEAADDLIKAGVDAVKVGIGPGSICTTRIVTGVGVPQITAIREVVKGRKKSKQHNIPIIADGGIKYSGDIAKALAAGADSVMIGSLFAGTDESPGEIKVIKGKKYKIYRGMGSLLAMQRGSKDRYGQAEMENKKLVPEGISGRVFYRGTVTDVIYQLVGGLRSSLGYLGVRNIKELQKKAAFVEISPAGLAESHPHSLAGIQNSPNYPLH